MNIEQLREVIACCASLHPNDDFATERCWYEMTAILSDNISATLHFFESECTNEELYWLGSVFEDVVEKTQSQELIDVLRARLAMVTPETYHQQGLKCKHMQKYVDYAGFVRSVGMEIDYAEGRLLAYPES